MAYLLLPGVDRYDVHCTSAGCFRGYLRDDIENAWPSWGVLGAPGLVRLLPGSWVAASCGPLGCGPVQAACPAKVVLSDAVALPVHWAPAPVIW